MFWCALRFFIIRKNGSKKFWIKFCVKNEIKCAKTFEMLTMEFGEFTTESTTEHKFNCGITSLRKAEKM